MDYKKAWLIITIILVLPIIVYSQQPTSVPFHLVTNDTSASSLIITAFNNSGCSSILYNETFPNKFENGEAFVVIGEDASKGLSLDFNNHSFYQFFADNVLLNFTNATEIASGDTTCLGIRAGQGQIGLGDIDLTNFNIAYNQTNLVRDVNTTVNLQNLLNITYAFLGSENITINSTLALLWTGASGSGALISNNSINFLFNTTSFNVNLSSADCSAGNLVIGVQANGSVLCVSDSSGGDISNTSLNILFNQTSLIEDVNTSVNLQNILNGTYAFLGSENITINSTLALLWTGASTIVDFTNVTYLNNSQEWLIGQTLIDNFNWTMGSAGNITSNTTCIRLIGLTSTLNIC